MATLQVSPLFPCWQTKGYKPFPFLLRGKGERETRGGGGGRDKEGKIMEPAMRKGRKKWEGGERKRETRRGAEESFTSSSPIWIPFISCSSLIAMAKTSKTMLKVVMRLGTLDLFLTLGEMFSIFHH